MNHAEDSRLVRLMLDHMDLIRRIRPTSEEIDLVCPENIDAAGDERSTIALKVQARPDPDPQRAEQPQGTGLMVVPEPRLEDAALQPIMTQDRQQAMNELASLDLVDWVHLGIKRVDMDRVRIAHQRRRMALAHMREREAQNPQLPTPPAIPVPPPTALDLMHRFHTEVGSRGSGCGRSRNGNGQWVQQCHLGWDGYVHGVHINSRFEE